MNMDCVFPARPVRGFTLIEVIISMTIMAMIALMLYWSFAMGARVWETQGEKTAAARRQDVLLRLLDDDFRRIAAYSMLQEGGQTEFFAAGPTALFYVTRNGFAALGREGRALFFSCVFIRETWNGALEVAVYKTSAPEPGLVRELQDFQGMSQADRARYAPGPELAEQAVSVLEDLDEAGFVFHQESVEPFAGPVAGGVRRAGRTEQPEPLDEWVQSGFPGQVRLNVAAGDVRSELVLLPGSGAL
jgi:prepilin-type N-terminal cleavage/methylation domain-containing protein